MKIPLTQDKYAIVDKEVFKILSRYKWLFLKVNNKRAQRNGYAARTENYRTVYMHREIMNAPKGMEVDHINGDTLDNRRSNLRICSKRENHQNHEIHRNGKLVGTRLIKVKGKKGTYFYWYAQAEKNGKNYSLGRFANEIEAHKGYLDFISK